MKKSKILSTLVLSFMLTACGGSKEKSKRLEIESIKINDCASSCVVNFYEDYNLNINMNMPKDIDITNVFINNVEYTLSGENKFTINDDIISIEFKSTELGNIEHTIDKIKYVNKDSDEKTLVVNESIGVQITSPYIHLTANEFWTKFKTNKENFVVYFDDETREGFSSIYNLTNEVDEDIYFVSIKKENNEFVDNTFNQLPASYWDDISKFLFGKSNSIKPSFFSLVDGYSVDGVLLENEAITSDVMNRLVERNRIMNIPNISSVEDVTSQYPAFSFIEKVHKVVRVDNSIVWSVLFSNSLMSVLVSIENDTNKIIEVKILKSTSTFNITKEIIEGYITPFVNKTINEVNYTVGTSEYLYDAIHKVCYYAANYIVSNVVPIALNPKGYPIGNTNEKTVISTSKSELMDMLETENAYIIFSYIEGNAKSKALEIALNNFVVDSGKMINKVEYSVLKSVLTDCEIGSSPKVFMIYKGKGYTMIGLTTADIDAIYQTGSTKIIYDRFVQMFN